MKKILILLLPFLLTGCFGEAGKGNLINTCDKEEISNSFLHKTTYVISFKENEVNKIEIFEKYEALENDAEATLENVKESVESYNRLMEIKNGVTVKVDTDTKNNYTVSYDIKLNEISNENINELNISKDRTKLINNLKEQGMTCK